MRIFFNTAPLEVLAWDLFFQNTVNRSMYQFVPEQFSSMGLRQIGTGLPLHTWTIWSVAVFSTKLQLLAIMLAIHTKVTDNSHLMCVCVCVCVYRT